jgi:hypothetical protein
MWCAPCFSITSSGAHALMCCLARCCGCHACGFVHCTNFKSFAVYVSFAHEGETAFRHSYQTCVQALPRHLLLCLVRCGTCLLSAAGSLTYEGTAGTRRLKMPGRIHNCWQRLYGRTCHTTRLTNSLSRHQWWLVVCGTNMAYMYIQTAAVTSYTASLRNAVLTP